MPSDHFLSFVRDLEPKGIKVVIAQFAQLFQKVRLPKLIRSYSLWNSPTMGRQKL